MIRVDVRLHGSLGATGKGHGSDKAVMLGLEGDEPATVDVDAIAGRLQRIRADRSLRLLGKHAIGFDEREHLHFLTKAAAVSRERAAVLGGRRRRVASC